MPLTHGTLRGYSHYGCRCDECKEVWNARKRRYRTSPERRAADNAYQKLYDARRKAVDPVYAAKCKEAKRKAAAKIRADPARWAVVVGRSRKIQAGKRAKIGQLKVDRGCVDCGYRAHPAALDFDHVSGSKVMHIAALVNYGWSRVLEELDKCEVVCANCHRIRTVTRRKQSGGTT